MKLLHKNIIIPLKLLTLTPFSRYIFIVEDNKIYYIISQIRDKSKQTRTKMISKQRCCSHMYDLYYRHVHM